MIPSYYLLGIPSVSLNGSRVGGGCSVVRVSNEEFCMAPASSVLFDGVIPMITCSTTWARQLLTFSTVRNTLTITFTFMSTTSVNGTRIPFTGVSGIEVVMFNCPSKYHARTTSIVFKDNNGVILQHTSFVNYTSCDHVIRICTSNRFYTSSNEITLEFIREPGPQVYLMYLAEVTFYSSSDNYCTVGPITTSATPRSTGTTTTTNNISK